MNQLAFMSDLHIDANRFTDLEFETLLKVLRDKEVSHLHIAGDISNDFHGISQDFLEKLRAHLPVTYNLGNHDMLGLSEKEIEGQDFQKLPFGKKTLLSLAGWYDYSYAPQFSQKEHQNRKNFFWFDRKLKRPNTDPAITEAILQQLDKELARLTGEKLVSLHFVPHQSFLIDHPYFHQFNGFLGSQAFHDLFVKHGVSDVIFGHLHRRYAARTIDGVTYQARPLGYRREWQLVEDFFKEFPQFADLNTYRISKRYNAIKDLPEFQAYQEKRLYQELADSLILFPI